MKYAIIILIITFNCFPKGEQLNVHSDIITILEKEIEIILKNKPLSDRYKIVNEIRNKDNIDNIMKINMETFFKYDDNYKDVPYDEEYECVKAALVLNFSELANTNLDRRKTIEKAITLIHNIASIKYLPELEEFLFLERLKLINNLDDVKVFIVFDKRNYSSSLLKKHRNKLLDFLKHSESFIDSMNIYSLAKEPLLKNIKANDTTSNVRWIRSYSTQTRLNLNDEIIIDSIANAYKHYPNKREKLLKLIYESENKELIKLSIKLFNDSLFNITKYKDCYIGFDTTSADACSTGFQLNILNELSNLHKGDRFLSSEYSKFIYGSQNGEWSNPQNVKKFFIKLNKWFEEKYGIVPDKPYPEWVKQELLPNKCSRRNIY